MRARAHTYICNIICWCNIGLYLFKEWLLEYDSAVFRTDAIAMGQKLMHGNMIYHVTGKRTNGLQV